MTAPVLREAEFIESVANHIMFPVLLAEQFRNRHLRFTHPTSGVAAFDLITWPKHLCISGDMGCFVFKTDVPDLFEVFRAAQQEQKLDDQTLIILPAEWSEMLVAADSSAGFEEFSHEKFRAEVNNWLTDQEASPAAREAAEANVIAKLAESDEAAFQAACQFEHGEVRFYDFALDADCTDYTYRYLWNCYAIAWAISCYDEMMAVEAELAKSSLPAPETPA